MIRSRSCSPPRTSKTFRSLSQPRLHHSHDTLMSAKKQVTIINLNLCCFDILFL